MALVDPGPCLWALPDPAAADPGQDVVAVGADLSASTVFAAYRSGLFPMRLDTDDLAWWSPDPRGILPLEELRVSRSLRRSMRRFTYTVDRAFTRVMAECADERRPSGWITPDFIETYSELHRMGWAHSVEVWREDRLVGGLYGIEIGGLFAGESMFHRETDASKAALVACVRSVAARGVTLFDVQMETAHLMSMGAEIWSRDRYLDALGPACRAQVDLSDVEPHWEPPA